jgi:hypothetical protein
MSSGVRHSSIANEMTRKLSEVQARRNARAARAPVAIPAPAAVVPGSHGSSAFVSPYQGPLFARPSAPYFASQYVSPAATLYLKPKPKPAPRTRKHQNRKNRRTLRR